MKDWLTLFRDSILLIAALPSFAIGVKMLMEHFDWRPVVAIAFGLVLVFFHFFSIQRRGAASPPPTPRGEEAASPPPLPDPTPAPPIRESPELEPREERAYTKCSPNDLVHLAVGKTALDAKLATESEVGKWLTLQARVAQVKPPEQGILSVFMEDKENSYILLELRFDAARWQLHFQGIDMHPAEPWKREYPCVTGKIVSVRNPHLSGEPHIILEHCELVRPDSG